MTLKRLENAITCWRRLKGLNDILEDQDRSGIARQIVLPQNPQKGLDPALKEMSSKVVRHLRDPHSHNRAEVAGPEWRIES